MRSQARKPIADGIAFRLGRVPTSLLVSRCPGVNSRVGSEFPWKSQAQFGYTRMVNLTYTPK